MSANLATFKRHLEKTKVTTCRKHKKQYFYEKQHSTMYHINLNSDNTSKPGRFAFSTIHSLTHSLIDSFNKHIKNNISSYLIF